MTLEDWLRAENFANLSGRDANQSTPLMRAAQKGDLNMAKEILAAGADIAALNADGNNAFWLACFGENLALLDLLIEAGADVNHANSNGATALMFAASSSRTAVVAHLLKRGADLAAETPDGFSALDMAGGAEILHMLRAARQKARRG